MPTYRFEQVPLTAKKSVPCTICGKQVRRQCTFMQTISPFNKHPDGIPKSRIDILQELKAQANKWETAAETHPKCEAAA
ncbi:hypothetical protein J3A78_002338 [Streptomyces sp. PvR006]|uniref:hypothetical protein n=1 Tax=Streptomyces sp. PvR006 TaxID=2817860 RepID=UPI001AE2642B|nr:hypothetical protein [Streptomyces sp. PvR006]MBP2581860.1 hypothetical protein [Streptomyces sp. PvR006]